VRSNYNERKMSSPKIDRLKKPKMTSLIIEARVTSYEVFNLSILGDDIFRTLEWIESNQPYYTTLIYKNNIFIIRNSLQYLIPSFCRIS